MSANSDWLAKYKASLDNIVATKQTVANTWVPPKVIRPGGTTGRTPNQQDDLQTAYKLLEGDRKHETSGGPTRTTGGAGASGGGGLSASGVWSGTKSAINFIERPLYAISAWEKAQADWNKQHPNAPLNSVAEFKSLGKAALGGLKGETHTTGSDVLRAAGVKGRKTSAGVGFGLDLLQDPLNAIPFGAAYKGIKGLTAAGRAAKAARKVTVSAPIEHAAEELVTKGTTKAPAKTAASLVEHIRKNAAAQATKKTTPIVEIPPAVKPVKVAEVAPQVVTPAPVVDAAVPAVPLPTPKTGKIKPFMGKGEARIKAFYQHLNTNPTEKILFRGHEISIAALRSTPQAVEPVVAREIQDAIVARATKLARMPAAKVASRLITFHTADGAVTKTTSSIDRFAKLLQDGHVPLSKTSAYYDKAAIHDPQLAEFALHEPGDLKELHLPGANGAEAVGAYLERLGIKHSLIDPATGLPKTATKSVKGLAVRAQTAMAKTAVPQIDNVVPAAPAIDSVKPAEQIVQDVIDHGDTSGINSVAEALDPHQVNNLKATLAYAAKANIVDPSNIEKYPFLSGRVRAKRTSATPGEGSARRFNDWNEKAQYNVMKGLMGQKDIRAAVQAGIPKSALHKEAIRAMTIMDHVMPVMRATDKILRTEGVPATLGLDRRYAVSIADVLDSMPDTGFVAYHMFRGPTHIEHIEPTTWSKVGEVMLDHATGKLTVDEFRSSVAHILTSPVVSKLGKTEYTPMIAKHFAKLVKTDPQGADAYLAKLVQKIQEGVTPLVAKLEQNKAALVAHNINSARAISTKTLEAVARLFEAPGFDIGTYLRIAATKDTIAESVARQLKETGQEALAIAKTDVAAKLAQVIPPEVQAAAKSADKMLKEMANGMKPGRVLTERAASQSDELHAMDMADGVSLPDIGAQINRKFSFAVMKLWAPHWKNATVRPYLQSEELHSQFIAKTYLKRFSEINKRYAQKDVNAAFVALQRGTPPVTPSTMAAHAELQKVVATLFTDDPATNFFVRNGVTAEDFNRVAPRYGIPQEFHLSGDDFHNSWKSWQTDNPLDLLARAQATMQRVAGDRMLGAQLGHQFGSAVRTAEHTVQISKHNSIIGALLPEGHFYSPDIAKQMAVMDEAMKIAETPQKLTQISRYYDTALSMIKSGFTIYRPGHHFRNQVGDMMFSYLAGVNNPLVYSKALKVMTRNHGQYKDFDVFKALAENGIANPKNNGHLLYTKINGKKVSLNAGEVYAMAIKKGLLPDYRTLEAIGEEGVINTEFKFRPHLPGPLKGKAHALAAGTSEARDHYVRLAHFIDVLEKGKFAGKTAADALDNAAQEGARVVRKWHPDGSDLTHFEAKAARRTILFYSWMRKAIPLVLESAVTKPGKTLQAPKAFQAIADANGIDTNSLGDPFPEDQLFPSWIRDDILGPQWKNFAGEYWGVNPGIPFVDVGNDFLANPRTTMKTVLGSLTPFAKIPLEIANGDRSKGEFASDIRTGVPQKDRSDYVDQQIPIVSNLAGLTKKSPSSFIGTLLQGHPELQDKGISAGQTQDQQDTARGKYDTTNGVDSNVLLNLISGAGARNMSKPSYIQQARIELAKRQRGQ